MHVSIRISALAIIFVLIQSPLLAYDRAVGKLPDIRLNIPFKGLDLIGLLPGPIDNQLLSADWLVKNFQAIDAKGGSPQDVIRAKIEVLGRQYVYYATVVSWLAFTHVRPLYYKETWDIYQEYYDAHSKFNPEWAARFSNILVPLLRDYAATLTSSTTITFKTEHHAIPEDTKNVTTNSVVFDVQPNGTTVSFQSDGFFLIVAKSNFGPNYGPHTPYVTEKVEVQGAITIKWPQAIEFPRRFKIYKDEHTLIIPSPAFDSPVAKGGVSKFPPDDEPRRLVCRSWITQLALPKNARWRVVSAHLGRLAINWSIGYQEPRRNLGIKIEVAYVPKGFETDKANILELCNPMPITSSSDGRPLEPAGTCRCGMLPSSNSDKREEANFCHWRQCNQFCKDRSYEYLAYVPSNC